MWLDGITLEKFLIRIRILNQAQGHALILIYIKNLTLGLSILQKMQSISKTKLQFYQLSKPYYMIINHGPVIAVLGIGLHIAMDIAYEI